MDKFANHPRENGYTCDGTGIFIVGRITGDFFMNGI